MTNLQKTTSKSKLAANAASFVDNILSEGIENPLQVWIQIKAVEEWLDQVKKSLQESAQKEAAKFNGSKFNGAKVEVRNGGAIYDYSHDAYWMQATTQIAELQQKIKEREMFLRSLETELVNPETGELIQPAIRTGFKKDSIVITLDK